MIKLKKQLYKRIQKQISIKRMRIKFEKKKKTNERMDNFGSKG
jgi:hypothetical protein